MEEVTLVFRADTTYRSKPDAVFNNVNHAKKWASNRKVGEDSHLVTVPALATNYFNLPVEVFPKEQLVLICGTLCN